jgi:hypothetical protein
VSNTSPMTAPELQLRLNTSATAQLGRVVHDPRGNAIWDWAIETTTLAQSTVEELLGKLMDPMSFALENEVENAVRWGGDPYNRSC